MNEKIIGTRSYCKFFKVTVIHVYAYTGDAEEKDVPNISHEQLKTVVENVHKHDMVRETRDRNIKSGSNKWDERIMGKLETGTIYQQ